MEPPWDHMVLRKEERGFEEIKEKLI